MKKTILSMMIVIIASVAHSQSLTNQGRVYYEELVKFEIHMENMTPEMQAMLPKENKNSTVLYFTENESLYKNFEQKEDAVIEDEMEGGSVKIMISQPKNIVYRDLQKKKIIEQTEFMTRVFLIEGEMNENEWKLTGNQKMILGYPCQEAVKKEGEIDVQVWFTPAIPVSSGPGKYGDLPGLVLAIDADNGKRTINATSIELQDVDAENLQKPGKGKKVTKEEYKAIVEEKTKEMGEEGEGGHTIIMKISK